MYKLVGSAISAKILVGSAICSRNLFLSIPRFLALELYRKEGIEDRLNQIRDKITKKTIENFKLV